ncbi:hypothetical protein [Deinococcus multiflagellatus]|uniref:Uncharacterized protein n=1 Tax=Deinococcus multiflagellatus TaxID=1656887 RepID=A0ABW1ZQ04_9DEIO|nr:hypothetical protein [Deinococcus multiflagellatus]MBZ9715916.1 hypothetical protein [Deinococcus multiflagellatus]
MFERNLPDPGAIAESYEFVTLPLLADWDGRRTVPVYLADDSELSATVSADVADSLRRASVLARHGLCSRIDLFTDSSGLHVVGVYWEA